MLRWYRSQIKEHGALDATRLLWRVGWSRTATGLANKLLPEKILCPCCGWRGRKFYDYIELGYAVRHTVCPQCDSHARHRALFLWLNQVYQLKGKSGVALVFAPEKALAPIWNNSPQLQVFRVDIEPTRNVNFLADMQHVPITTSSVDLLWCHHVLEHVENDRAAIRELYRVLRPLTGELIVSVPMEIGTRTREYGFANKKESGHWRMYGDDFADRLGEGGFMVRTVDYNLSTEDCERYGVTREQFYICQKPDTSRS